MVGGTEKNLVCMWATLNSMNRIIMCVILPVYFYIHHIPLNISATDNSRNTSSKMQLTTRPGVRYF